MRTYSDLTDIYNRFVPVEYEECDNREELALFIKRCILEIDKNLSAIYESAEYNSLIVFFIACKRKYQHMLETLNDKNYYEIKRVLSFSLIFDNENLFIIRNGQKPNKEYYSTENKFINDKLNEINKRYKSPRI